MRFPEEWIQLGMYPDELANIQISGYESGHENASEHDRCGAFHWWLKREPSEENLKKLMFLASIDPESLMGYDIKSYIQKSKNCSFSVEKCWGKYA
jgi:hypothetical protein